MLRDCRGCFIKKVSTLWYYPNKAWAPLLSTHAVSCLWIRKSRTNGYLSIYTGARSRRWPLWLACAREGLVWLVKSVLVRRRKKRSGGITGSKSSSQMQDLAHPMFENIKWGSQSNSIGQSIPLLNCVEKEGSALTGFPSWAGQWWGWAQPMASSVFCRYGEGSSPTSPFLSL